MRKIAVNREPEILAQLIDREAGQLLELAGVNTRRNVDVGRSIFYTLAVNEYYDYIQEHSLTPGIVARKRAELQDEIELGKPEGRTRTPYAHLPLPPDTSVIVLDPVQFTELAAISLVGEESIGGGLIRSADHYFKSRADQ